MWLFNLWITVGCTYCDRTGIIAFYNCKWVAFRKHLKLTKLFNLSFYLHKRKVEVVSIMIHRSSRTQHRIYYFFVRRWFHSFFLSSIFFIWKCFNNFIFPPEMRLQVSFSVGMDEADILLSTRPFRVNISRVFVEAPGTPMKVSSVKSPQNHPSVERLRMVSTRDCCPCLRS